MSKQRKLIGTRDFYRMLLAISVPIMIQNGISNFVNLLDNLMIGRLGTNALSGVAIGNQLMFVFNLVMFGATCGVGIFTAQYFGDGDTDGVRYTFRAKLMINLIMSVAVIIVFWFKAGDLISLFLQGEGEAADALETLQIGTEYMRIMLIGIPPIAVAYAYSGTLRDCGETRVPMISSVSAIFVNLIGNFLLIYGYFGLPALGARGAAVATVISRFVEVGVLVIYTAKHSEKHAFIRGAFSHFRLPLPMFGRFFVHAIPLMANETLWALGNVFMNQCYSYRSLNAVAAINIQSTIWNLVAVAAMAMGESVGIVVGQQLGSGDIAKAKDTAGKMIAFTVFFGVISGVILLIVSPFFPLIYKTSPEIQALATRFIVISGIMSPFHAFTHASYFTIRSGGRTGITFAFDACFSWLVAAPLAFALSRFTSIDIVLMLAIVQCSDVLKCIIGYVLVRSGIWARQIVE